MILSASSGVDFTSVSRLASRKALLSMIRRPPRENEMYCWQCYSATGFFCLRHFLHRVVRVIALQIVEYNGDWNRLGIDPQFFVALVVHSSAEASGNVAMVFYRVPEVFPKQRCRAEWAV